MSWPAALSLAIAKALALLPFWIGKRIVKGVADPASGARERMDWEASTQRRDYIKYCIKRQLRKTNKKKRHDA